MESTWYDQKLAISFFWHQTTSPNTTQSKGDLTHGSNQFHATDLLTWRRFV